ncbi:cytochrome c-type biogenesis protein CcmH [Bacillus sp. FJAT-29814]|uniref:cytochrome c-type biogenesis protein CcmH n=1 Tax=Bacillus sp. FJAT-29814 TaxID=1729688 RepID=UPI00082F4A43|nr:cytochrome c-type biogenesis protein CcmH [Bacillus sp. FJAT-29814]
MKRIFGLVCVFMLFSSSLHAVAEEKSAKQSYDYTNSEFKATVDMLYMDGHSNDDLASCQVKQEYYQDVGGMFFDKGMSKDEILDYYKNELGVFAVNAPPGKGFNLVLWVLPFLLIFIMFIIIYYVVKRWKRNQFEAPVEEQTYSNELDDVYASMIEEERKKFV